MVQTVSSALINLLSASGGSYRQALDIQSVVRSMWTPLAVFHGFDSAPSAPIKSNLTASAFSDVLDNTVLPTSQQHFG